MSLVKNYEYIRDWANNKFLTKDDKIEVDLSNLVEKDEINALIASGTESLASQIDDLSERVDNVAQPGTLNTTSTSALSTNSSESLSGSISLHKIAKTGSYNDLNNKPTIPAAQVQSDWNATSGMGVILNKPTIPTTTSSVTSGSSAALTSGGAYSALSGKENTSNKVTSISSSSTDTQYPSAKAVYTQIGNIEAVLNQIIQPS